MTRNYVSCWAALLIGCLSWILAACSSDANLYEYVSAEDAVIAQCDLTKIIDNTGSEIDAKGIELSPSLQKLMVYLVSGRDRQHLDDLLAVRGMDLSNVIVAVNEHMDATVVFKVTDPKKLKEYLQALTYGEMQQSEERGYTIYTLDKTRTVYISGNTACMLVADRSVDVSDIETIKERAASAPLQQWQKEALKQGSTYNMLMNVPKYSHLAEEKLGSGFGLSSLKVGYDEAQLEHAFAKVNVSLDGLELNGTVAMVDDNDQPLVSKYADLKVDTSLMKYASADDIFVALTAMPDTGNWPAILNQLVVEMGGYLRFGLDRETVNTIGDVLNDIDGTVMLAAGPKNVLKINNTEGWDAVLAVQMKPGMADKYMSQIKQLIEATNASMADLAGQYAAIGYRGYKPKQMTCTEYDGGMKIALPETGAIYMKVIDNVLIASLSPVAERGGCTIAASDFAGMSGGTMIRIARNNAFSPIMKLPFGIDASYVSDSQTAHFSLKETDTEGRMLENIFKLIAGQSR